MSNELAIFVAWNTYEKDLSLLGNDVRSFYSKFGYEFPKNPSLKEAESALTSVVHLREELEELEQALRLGDIVEAADGVTDVLYLIVGVAAKLGLPLGALFYEVQRSNMEKVYIKGAKPHALDIVKPQGWKPPQVREVLRTFGLGFDK
jgi:hypothetical protein